MYAPTPRSSPARPSTPDLSDSCDYTLFGGIATGLSGVNTYGSAAHPHAITATTAGQREMTYNAAGELELLESVPSGGAVSRAEDYMWDRLGRLAAVVVDSTSNNVTSRVTTVRNRYDVDRQRVLRIEDKPGTAPDSVTVFLPGMDFTVTVDAAGVRSHKISRYVSIAGTTVAVRSVTTGGGWTIDWLLGNHQGSITAAVRSGSGAVTRNWFDPYGGERGSSTMVTDRDFLGQETDTAVGLSYLNNRYYDPAIGMFLSVDPLVATTGEAYVYGSGNPITLSDPTGLCSVVHHDGETCADAIARQNASSGGGSSGGNGGGGTASAGRKAVAAGLGVVSVPDRGGKVEGSEIFDLVPRQWADYYRNAPPQNYPPEFVVELPFGGLSYADSQWMQRSPFKAVRVAAIREKIVSRGDVSGGDSAGNARQHILLASYLTIEFGEDQARFMLMAHENVNIYSDEAFGPLDAPRAMDLVNNEIGVQVGNLAANEFGYSGWDFTAQIGGGLWNDDTYGYVDRMIDQLMAAEVPVWLE